MSFKNKINMLSANKVKLHGMVSKKWTTRDKITQYKGLVTLYTRDKAIVEMENDILAKKQQEEVKNMQNDIEDKRKQLDNAIWGNKLKIRNTLSQHKELQLAYQHSPPKKVLEMISQINFTKRKELDRIRYKMKLKSQQLIELQLKCADFEDRIKLAEKMEQKMLPEEKQAHIITGKVQDTILKKEAASVIQQSYRQIIAIMRKDSRYFDPVLVSIKNDGLYQAKCMLDATRLGQFATEYLDDKRQEFETLERAVRRDLAYRKEDLMKANLELESLMSNTKYLLRRDSDINMGKVEVKTSSSLEDLQTSLSTIEDSLSKLKYAIFVPTYHDIYPCLQDQVEQRTRLNRIVKELEENKEILLSKSNHAYVLKSCLETTMLDTTLQYKIEKTKLQEELILEENLNIQNESLIELRCELVATIGFYVKHLQLLLELFNNKNEETTEKTKGDNVIMKKLFKKQPQKFLLENEPEDCQKIESIIEEITQTCQEVGENTVELTLEDKFKAYSFFEEILKEKIDYIMTDPARDSSQEDLIMDDILCDSTILSREDIKKQSADIVVMNSKIDDLPAESERKLSIYKNILKKY